MTDVEISVVIAVRNGAAFIGEQLDALAAQDFDGTWEVVVADNGSTDTTRSVVSARIPGFRVPLVLVDASGARGAAHARNVGARAARADRLAFCDADDHVLPDWLEAASQALDNFPAARGILRDLRPDRDPSARIVNPWVLSGVGSIRTGNFCIRTPVYWQVGGFEERMPVYGGEDVEFSVRLRRTVADVAVAPGMQVLFRPTTGLWGKVWKVVHVGMSEPYIWTLHPSLYPTPDPVRLARDLVAWPFRAGRQGTEKPASGWLRRLGRVIGAVQVGRRRDL